MPFVEVDQAVDRIRRGEMVVVVDAYDRENEGDITMAADFVTPEAIGFMIREARGLVCMPCDPARLDELRIPPMVSDGSCDTAFTVSIDHRLASTGISAQERALTIQRVLDSRSRPEDFVRPGHVFPLRARPGGVLERPGHTEASVELARLAGLSPCAVICEVLNEDGSVARLRDLEIFVRRHGLALLAIEQLISHCSSRRRVIEPARPL